MTRDTSRTPLVCREPGGWVAICMAGCFGGDGGALTIANGTKRHCETESAAHHADDIRLERRLTPPAMFPPAKIGTVPNKPKTPTSTFRVPLELKDKAAAKAKAEGKTLTDVVVQGLEDYVKEEQ